MTATEGRLPSFTYFWDPIGNGSIVKKEEICPCCERRRDHIYTGPIYSTVEVELVCPWCIAEGTAAAKWSASFNDVHDVPPGVPAQVALEVETRTPGYESWQGNRWLFSQDDALVFLGEVCGAKLLEERKAGKVKACQKALREWHIEWSAEDLKQIVRGGQPAIYLFQDRTTGAFDAYADMT